MRVKNRGAISNPEGRFEIQTRETFYDGWDLEDESELPYLETILFQDKAKTVITRNDSPDIGFEQSINPYRGCEHGCIYCYARPSHAYMNMSPGLDFETKIFYKVDAATILAKELDKPKYSCKPIVVGANTDPYQLELACKKFKLNCEASTPLNTSLFKRPSDNQLDLF